MICPFGFLIDLFLFGKILYRSAFSFPYETASKPFSTPSLFFDILFFLHYPFFLFFSLMTWKKLSPEEKKKQSQERINSALNAVVDRFQNGDIPEVIAMASFPIPDIPAAKWSLHNRILMVLAETQDARGIKQWNEVGRKVKKGSKAFYILGPRFADKKDKDSEEGKEKKERKAAPTNDIEGIRKEQREKILIGFFPIPVFRVEDTEGKPLDYEELELPEMPLMEVAQEWGISLKAVPGNYKYHGYYRQHHGEQGNELIAIATPEECVFFHELSHAAHKRIKGELRGGQDPLQEIVAETSAAVLCRLVGKDGEKHLGNSYQYIDGYAKKADLTVGKACLKVLGEVERMLNLILRKEEVA